MKTREESLRVAVRPIVRLAGPMVTAVVGMAVAPALAGFTVSANLFSTANGLDQYRIVAVNTGGGTGVQVKGLEYFYSGSPVAFEVTDNPDPVTGDDPNGIPDTVNLTSATRSRIRVNGVAASNVFIGVSPDNGFVEPNPYLNPVGAFQGAIANTSNTNATGAGFEIARLYLPAYGSGVFSGNIGGDIGSKVPFSVSFGVVCHCGHPMITPIADTHVVFSQVVTNGAPFSVVVNVTSSDAGDVLSLTTGALPAGVTIDSITGGGMSPATFTVNGKVDYSLNGTSVVVPLIATDGWGDAGLGSFRLIITPEPGIVSILFPGLAMFGCRRGLALR